MKLPVVLLASAAVVLGCSDPPKPPPPAPPQVTVAKVERRAVTVTGEAVGEVRAFREVELRPQVSGRVREIRFQPGERIEKGQVLFVIDPRSYEASLAQEQAALADAQATLARAQRDVARYKALLPERAIPRATYDAAVAAAKSAAAPVAQRKAAIEKLRLDVQHTEVRSPVDGQIGFQQVDVGGLALEGQTVLAVVSTLDPVYVEFSIPEADYVRFMRANAAAGGSREARERPIRLVLPDGSEYSEPGLFAFAERAISSKTGTLELRARFPNPQRLLRPGLNVRVRLIYDELPDALVVPERAVSQVLGRQFVTVVGPENRAEQRAVELGERLAQGWIVRSGLEPGERVIVEGTQKAPPGTVVAPRSAEG